MKVKKSQVSTDKSQMGGVLISDETLLNKFEVQKVTAEERLHMISEAAYYRAEHRCFQCGCQVQDWLEAEIEIDKLLATDPHLFSPQ